MDPRINLSTEMLDRITVMGYGPSGSGKTHFLATFPRPYILADAVEGGWKTVKWMDRSLWYEPDVEPEVWPIKSPEDVVEHLKLLNIRVRNKPGDILTLGVDSLTFIADLYYARIKKLIEGQAKENKSGKVNKFEVWEQLAGYLRNIMEQAHAIPGINVVWLALEREPAESGQDGGISLGGQMKGKLPAAVDIWGYMRAVAAGDDLKHEMHLRRFGAFPARHRFGTLLPPFIVEPTYRRLMEHLHTAVKPMVRPAARPAPRPVQQSQRPPVQSSAARVTSTR